MADDFGADPAFVPTASSQELVSTKGFNPGEGFLLKPFVVEVENYGAFAYPAASRGKALAEAWRDYRICSDASFGDFLRIARARMLDRAPRFGEPITVAGKPAFYVGERGQYVRFARPGETETFLSHPADVTAQAIETRSATTEDTGVARKGESAVPKECAQGDTP